MLSELQEFAQSKHQRRNAAALRNRKIMLRPKNSWPVYTGKLKQQSVVIILAKLNVKGVHSPISKCTDMIN